MSSSNHVEKAISGLEKLKGEILQKPGPAEDKLVVCQLLDGISTLCIYANQAQEQGKIINEIQDNIAKLEQNMKDNENLMLKHVFEYQALIQKTKIVLSESEEMLTEAKELITDKKDA